MFSCDYDDDTLELLLEMRLPADVGLIDELVECVGEILAARGIASEEACDIALALNEALANAIIHGSRRDVAKVVNLCVIYDLRKGLQIIVRDSGAGFDPKKVPTPTRSKGLYSESGRGLFLMRRLMDQVSFSREGSEIRLLKKRLRREGEDLEPSAQAKASSGGRARNHRTRE